MNREKSIPTASPTKGIRDLWMSYRGGWRNNLLISSFRGVANKFRFHFPSWIRSIIRRSLSWMSTCDTFKHKGPFPDQLSYQTLEAPFPILIVKPAWNTLKVLQTAHQIWENLPTGATKDGDWNWLGQYFWTKTQCHSFWPWLMRLQINLPNMAVLLPLIVLNPSPPNRLGLAIFF